MHPKPSGRSNLQIISFLKQNPSVSHSLLTEYDHNLDKITTLIEPVLHAFKRCELTCFYIQALTTERTTFLATNLAQMRGLQVTAIATSWLIGRSRTCAISVPNLSVSRCHAVIGYDPNSGFHITDIGSSNGSRVNRRKLTPLDRVSLEDGDLIELGSVKLEFFVSGWQTASSDACKITSGRNEIG